MCLGSVSYHLGLAFVFHRSTLRTNHAVLRAPGASLSFVPCNDVLNMHAESIQVAASSLVAVFVCRYVMVAVIAVICETHGSGLVSRHLGMHRVAFRAKRLQPEQLRSRS